MYPAPHARLDEQNVGRRQRKYSRMQVWATQFNGENNNNKETKQTRSNTKQNNWPCKCRAAVNCKFC